MTLEGTIQANGNLTGELSQRNGIDGKDGKDGENGYTPVRGVDYWTVADKAEIREYVDGEIVEQLSEKADIIVSSASGTVIPLSDSAEAKLKGLLVHGKSTQDGTQTPSAPIYIVNAGKYNEATGKYDVDVIVSGRNFFDKSTIIPHSYVSNSDGHIGTTTNTSDSTYVLNASDYINVKGMTSIYIHSSYTASRWGAFYDSGKNFISGISGYDEAKDVPDGACYIRLTIHDTALDTFIVIAGTSLLPYEPYRPVQTVTLSLSEPIRSLPDGTSDIVHVDRATGTAWVERKIIEFVLDGSADELWALAGTNTSGKYRFDCYSYRNICKGYADTAIPSNVYCNQYVAMSPDKNYMKNDSIALRYDGDIYIYEEEYSEKTLDEFRARLSANPITVIAELATPTTEELTAEMASQILELTSYYPNTVVYNDQGTDKEVEYVADTKNYIDGLVKTLKTAIIALGGSV